MFRFRRSNDKPSGLRRDLTLEEIERFGGGGSAPGGAAIPYVDNRLRGIDPAAVGAHGPNAANKGYDASARRYAVMSGDPQEQAVRHEAQLGRRVPAQYQTPSAQAGLPSVTGQHPSEDGIYQDMHSPEAAWNAAAVAGQRQTQWGTQGARTDTAGGPWWPARQRFGYGEAGYRGAGYSEEFDSGQNLERRAGRLTATTAFDQEVSETHPYLHIRARGESTQVEGTYEGNALIEVTVGNFGAEGGAEDRRRFWVGGGLLGVFNLRGWNNVRIEVVEILDGTFVEFAWTQDGLPGDNSTLLLPQVYTASANVMPVPNGAYAVTIENPAPAIVGTVINLQWIGRIGGAPFTFTTQVSDNSVVATPRPYVYFCSVTPVLAPAFRIDTSVDLVWWLRTI
jgi:hypothetical protein